MLIMKFGDRLICENGKTYTLGVPTRPETIWDTTYDFSILDETGTMVDEVTTYHLERCLAEDQNVKRLLSTGFDENGFLIRTKVLACQEA